MFRLFRLLVLALFVFIAGMMAERSMQKDRCLDYGGSWNDDKICDLE